MDYDDLDVEDVTGNANKKAKVKSGAKGKSAERDIVHILNNHFEALLAKNPAWGKFSRSVGSGNRWGQKVDLPQHAKDTFTGDLCTPQNFLWVIESKKGYNDIDLCTAFSGKCTELDDFLKQVTDDSGRCGRKPMLLWKKDRKPRLAFMRKEDNTTFNVMRYYFVYGEWVGMTLDELLAIKENRFFFS